MENGIQKFKPLSFDEINSISEAFYKSGMFPDVKSQAQAIVKIQAGQEMGVAPFSAMSGIHIILGKAEPGAKIISAKIKSSGKYDYKVLELNDEVCRLEFSENGKPVGVSEFSIRDAKRAQVKNIEKFPRNMLFARAISNGQKWFAPEALVMPVYVEGELEDSGISMVNTETGDVVENGKENQIEEVKGAGVMSRGEYEKWKTKDTIPKNYSNYEEVPTKTQESDLDFKL